MTNDYEDFIDEAEGTDALAKLGTLATELYEAEGEVSRCEETLKKAQKARDHLSQVQIPEVMEEAGLKKIETPSGITLEVISKIRGSLNAQSKNEAMNWLVENGHGGIVKHELVIALGKGDEEGAEELLSELETQGRQVKDSRSVHTSTLGSWMKEQLKEGEKPPSELFNIFEQRQTKIKKKKED